MIPNITCMYNESKKINRPEKVHGAESWNRLILIGQFKAYRRYPEKASTLSTADLYVIHFYQLPNQRMRVCLLLLASCYFYMCFVPAYIFILGGIISDTHWSNQG